MVVSYERTFVAGIKMLRNYLTLLDWQKLGKHPISLLFNVSRNKQSS